jgi:hypothetical protein
VVPDGLSLHSRLAGNKELLVGILKAPVQNPPLSKSSLQKNEKI